VIKMGRPKGGKNRTWTFEEKLQIVQRYLNEDISQPSLARETGVGKGLIGNWVSKYSNEGEAGLLSKRTGNRFSALHTSKSLSEVDRLRLIVAKQEIEIERLKKGYLVKGDGTRKEFVTTNDVNMKSSKD
jgi:transposase-like protein